MRFSVGPQAYLAYYDDNGNMTHRVREGVAYIQTYNAENRLASILSMATDETTTFTYDGDGTLVKKVAGGQTTVYVGPHYEKNLSTGEVTKYYSLNGQRVAMRKGSTLTYLHGDHLGSASLATDASGGVISEMRYYPYGATRWTYGTMPTDRRRHVPERSGKGIHRPARGDGAGALRLRREALRPGAGPLHPGGLGGPRAREPAEPESV